MDVDIIQADYGDPQHRDELPRILNAYASAPMGGGVPLNDFAKDNLVEKLFQLPHAFSVLTYGDRAPAGLVNCFKGFAIFVCQSLINIHDVVVWRNFRRLGLSQDMLQKVETIARDPDCCKITLEILSNNTIAQKTHAKSILIQKRQALWLVPLGATTPQSLRG